MPSHSASHESASAPHLESLGWQRETAISRYLVESTHGESWTISRLWSTAGTLHSTVLPPGMSRVLIGVAGTATITAGDREQLLQPRTLLFVPGHERVTTVNTGVWARGEWHLRAPELAHDKLRLHAGIPLPLDAANYALLTALTNIVSTNAAFVTSRGTAHILGMLGSAVTASVLDATTSATGLSASQVAIVELARRVIHERHADSEFSVTDLARELAVSKFYLHRLFAATGTTPGHVLEAQRVSNALRLLALSPSGSPGAAADVARLVGFRTVRTMYAALARQGADSRSGAPEERPDPPN